MLGIQLVIGTLGCFRMLIVLEICQIQNLRREEFFARSEVRRWCQFRGHARNKQLFRTEIISLDAGL